MTEVHIIAGSRSDEKIVKKVTDTLDSYDIKYSLDYASAHREPERVKSIVTSSNARVFIAVAGLAAALPGVVASLTKKPVIGVPVSAALGGLDALLSIVQMPKGVPVATVGIDNGQNAAHLAVRILETKSVHKQSVPSSYAEAGVDEAEVSKGLDVLGEYVRKSFSTSDVTQDYGHYANAIRINDEMSIAISTDGVGSKILVAEMAGRFDTVGIDCVAMNVNDLICIGAMPVGFVDYLASERPLSEDTLHEIGQGLLEGCRQSSIPLLGGETAILPEMIKGVSGPGIDLAGTAVGIVENNQFIDGSKVADGDVILGLDSNGLHSNGFTLSRKVIFSKYEINDELPWGEKVADEMLRPTRIYVNEFKALCDAGVEINGIAHVTGSGFRKILRLSDARFRIDKFPELPNIFNLIHEIGQISHKEMFTTFNMGIGLVVVVPEQGYKQVMDIVQESCEIHKLGVVEKADQGVVEIVPYQVIIK